MEYSKETLLRDKEQLEVQKKQIEEQISEIESLISKKERDIEEMVDRIECIYRVGKYYRNYSDTYEESVLGTQRLDQACDEINRLRNPLKKEIKNLEEQRSGHRDSLEEIDKALLKIENIRLNTDPEYKEQKQKEKYNNLVAKMKNAQNEWDYQNLIGQFHGMGGYSNSGDLADECEKQYSKLNAEREEQERIKAQREKEERERRRIAEEERRAELQRKRKIQKRNEIIVVLSVLSVILIVGLIFLLNAISENNQRADKIAENFIEKTFSNDDITLYFSQNMVTQLNDDDVKTFDYKVKVSIFGDKTLIITSDNANRKYSIRLDWEDSPTEIVLTHSNGSKQTGKGRRYELAKW